MTIVSVRRLKAPFIKFEDASRHYRPVREEFQGALPALHYDSAPGGCPFFPRGRAGEPGAGAGAAPGEAAQQGPGRPDPDPEDRAEAEERDRLVGGKQLEIWPKRLRYFATAVAVQSGRGGG